MINALHRVGFPVPQPLLLCNDASVIRTSFYLMEYVKVCIIVVIIRSYYCCPGPSVSRCDIIGSVAMGT